jgi:tRNA (adenine57-N1/adenine58-N1)-methyltransferase catalytic subunit
MTTADVTFRFPDTLLGLKRGPAIIQPKDIGMILGYTGSGKETVCVDAGTGSAFLSISLANTCKHVYSYERKKEFFELASANAEKKGVKNLTIKNKDIMEGIEEKEVGLVTLDLPDAEKAVPLAYNALAYGGWCVGYTPNVEQAKAFYMECHRAMFTEIFMLECMVREYEVREYGVRPVHFSLSHTAYLVFAKKGGGK